MCFWRMGSASREGARGAAALAGLRPLAPFEKHELLVVDLWFSWRNELC